MKFKGKIAIWFWCILIAANAFFLYTFIFTDTQAVILAAAACIFNLVYLPCIIRNYCLLEGDTLTVYFGFGKDSIGVYHSLTGLFFSFF